MQLDDGVTVIIPQGSESRIDQTVNSLFLQGLRNIEIFIVYNGIQKVVNQDYSNLYNPLSIPVYQITLPKRGKGNAINKGIFLSTYPIIAVIDADCVLGPNALQKAFSHFSDKKVMAVGGRLKVLKPKNLLQNLEEIEYEKVFNISKVIFNKLNADFLISGAFGLFRKDALLLIGGFSTDTVGEDMDVILNLQRCLKPRGMKIVYDTDAVCYTGVPSTIQRLLHQRDRWQRGLLDCLIKNSVLMLNCSYGALGLISLPYQLVLELLQPFHVIFGIGFVCIKSFSLFFKAFFIDWGFQMLLSLVARKSVREKIFKSWFDVFLLSIGNALDIFLQFPLCIIRIYGMVTFRWRRLVW